MTEYAGVGLLITGLCLYLDAAGVFIYVTYVPLYASALVYFVMGYFVMGLRTGPNKGTAARRAAVAPNLIAIIISGAIALTSILRTSERKGFYLDAKSIRAGMPISLIQDTMGQYEVFDRNRGSVTFSYRANQQTTDHLIIELTEDLQYAKRVRYSVD